MATSTNSKVLRIYHKEPLVKSLGPGRRYGLWLQGCQFACKGCIVPKSWPMHKGIEVEAAKLSQEIISCTDDITGVSISGGEPLLQLDNLTLLLETIRDKKPELTFVVYTGFELDEAIDIFGQKITKLLACIDVLITGRFESDWLANDGIRGSSNQQIFLVSGRISRSELSDWAIGEEVVVRSSDFFTVGVPTKQKLLK